MELHDVITKWRIPPADMDDMVNIRTYYILHRWDMDLEHEVALQLLTRFEEHRLIRRIMEHFDE